MTYAFQMTEEKEGRDVVLAFSITSQWADGRDLLLLEVQHRHAFDDWRIYAKVRGHVLEGIIDDCGRAVSGMGIVDLWGLHRATSFDRSEVSWAGVKDFATSPLRAAMAPHVAEAIGHRIDEEEVRTFLHRTGFLDRDAPVVEVLRFLGRAAA